MSIRASRRGFFSFLREIAAPLCLGIFAVSIGLMLSLGTVRLEPAEAAGWDVLIKAVGGAAALLAAVVAMQKYFVDREAAQRTSLIEARKPYFVAQQEVYSELLNATAKISNPGAVTAAELAAAHNAFWILYWGKLPLVTDNLVGQAVNAFEEVLCAGGDVDERRLRNLSMELARACRNSLGFVENQSH